MREGKKTEGGLLKPLPPGSYRVKIDLQDIILMSYFLFYTNWYDLNDCIHRLAHRTLQSLFCPSNNSIAQCSDIGKKLCYVIFALNVYHTEVLM